MSIPKKRRGTSTDHDKGLNRFYDQIVQGVIRHIDFSVVKVLLVGSPGFYKDGLYKFMMGNSQTNPDYAVRSENKSIMENKSKIVLVHCSSGHKQALTEALSEPGIQAQLVNTKYAGELNALNDFYRVLGNDPAKAFYGYEYVIKAAEQGAISTLMVTDGLFR